MKYWRTRKRSPSTQPTPIRNAAVPAPPASPVVSVSRNTARRRSNSSSSGSRGQHADRVGLDRVEARERHVAVADLEVHGALDQEELAALVLDAHPVDELLERDRERSAAPRASRPRPPRAARAAASAGCSSSSASGARSPSSSRSSVSRPTAGTPRAASAGRLSPWSRSVKRAHPRRPLRARHPGSRAPLPCRGCRPRPRARRRTGSRPRRRRRRSAAALGQQPVVQP